MNQNFGDVCIVVSRLAIFRGRKKARFKNATAKHESDDGKIQQHYGHMITDTERAEEPPRPKGLLGLCAYDNKK